MKANKQTYPYLVYLMKSPLKSNLYVNINLPGFDTRHNIISYNRSVYITISPKGSRYYNVHANNYGNYTMLTVNDTKIMPLRMQG